MKQQDLDRTANVLTEILEERVRQNEKWGGPDHDDQHEPAEWEAFVRQHLERGVWARQGKEERRAHRQGRKDTWRAQLVRAAALAVAAVESHDRRTNTSATTETKTNPARCAIGLTDGTKTVTVEVSRRADDVVQFQEAHLVEALRAFAFRDDVVASILQRLRHRAEGPG